MKAAKNISVSELPAECRKLRHGKPPTWAQEIDYWEVRGQSWAGRPTKRDGKRVNCGHKHKSEEACQKCLKRMKKEKPGNCQVYRVEHVQGYRIAYCKS